MKILYILFVFILGMGLNASAQDKIELNEGGKYDVKIVKKTDDALYVYMLDDKSKLVKKVPMFVVKNFEYNSIDDPKYKTSDSLLYVSYLNMIETNIRSQNIAPTPTQVNVTYENTGPKYDSEGYLLPSTPQDYFLKSKNQLIASAVVGVIGTVLFTALSAKATPTASDITTSSIALGVTSAISTGLTISSTINLYRGLLLFK